MRDNAEAPAALWLVDPPGPVRSLSVDVLPDGDGVRITWKTPANLTVRVRGYVLTYRAVGVGNCNDSYRGAPISSPEPLPDNATGYSLTGLAPWIKYRIDVRAVSVAGVGHQASDDVIMPGSG